MLRGMIFIDHMNFDIALKSLYKRDGKQTPRLDYNLLFKEIIAKEQNVDFLKAYLFFPKPDAFLMQKEELGKYYKWVSGMKNGPFTDVIAGRYVSRPTGSLNEMDINDSKTYYKEEKGTDINFAITALSNAFFNSYDVGFFVSADTDYITVYDMLKRIGKIVIQVSVLGQNATVIRSHVDKQLILKQELFEKCLRKPKER